jgi:hypothetical protein
LAENAALVQQFLLAKLLARRAGDTKDAEMMAIISDVNKLSVYITKQCQQARHRLPSSTTTEDAVSAETSSVVPPTGGVASLDVSFLSTPTKAVNSGDAQQEGFDRLLTKLLSPPSKPAGRPATGNVAAAASLVTPERGATFYRSLLESPAAVNRTDISSVGRTTEDDEASVFELLQSVDNWQSLKTFVRYNSTSQLRNNDAGDGDDGDVVRLADMTPPPSPTRAQPSRPSKQADTVAAAARRPAAGEMVTVARTLQALPSPPPRSPPPPHPARSQPLSSSLLPPPPLTWGLLGQRNRHHGVRETHQQRPHSNNNLDLRKSISLAIQKGGNLGPTTTGAT